MPTPSNEPQESNNPDRVTIVTGASRGIGAATARRLATHGGRLLLTYAQQDHAAEAVAAEVRSLGGRAETVAADVASEADVLALFAKADALGPLVGLVNNAGIVAPITAFENYSADRLARIMAVNVTGSFLCAREAVKRMSTRRGGIGGSIVNVSSRAATLGSPNEFIDYAASKGAVDTMTRGLAVEVGGAGIRVNAVRPGLIETDIHQDSGDPGRLDRLVTNVPMGRTGDATEVADLIVWLLGPESSYVSGALIDVGGGR